MLNSRQDYAQNSDGKLARNIVVHSIDYHFDGSFMVSIRQFFALSHKLIQRSVALCRDDFIAGRLTALAEHFGAKTLCLRVEREGLNVESQNRAREFVGHVLIQRLHRRGRKKSR